MIRSLLSRTVRPCSVIERHSIVASRTCAVSWFSSVPVNPSSEPDTNVRQVQVTHQKGVAPAAQIGTTDSTKPVQAEACGDDIVDDEMEQEEMFVEPHESFAFRVKEWGGPRRGGRLPEPTRFGDWERKGRCTDF
jgi:hypothetical protein